MLLQAQTQPAQPVVPTVVLKGPGGATTLIPAPRATLTSRDIAALKTRREELSNQLQSVDGRRQKLLTQLAGTSDETARKGLEDRISLLDKRQLQLESDIAETGRELSSTPASMVATAASPSAVMMNKNVSVVLGGLFIVFVLGPLAIGTAVAMLKRSWRRHGPAANQAADSQRLERIEQAIDAIAVEVERVSEGQRFVTRLLSDGQQIPAIGAGRIPEPVRANQ